MQDPAGDGISLLRKKLQRSRLQIQKQRPLQDEKELVLGLMLGPLGVIVVDSWSNKKPKLDMVQKKPAGAAWLR